MKTRSVGAVVSMLAGVMFLSGCAMAPGGISASNTPLHNREYTVVAPYVRDTNSRVYLFQIIPISGANTTRGAINAAIRRHHGDAMIDITVEHYTQNWILFSRYVTRVEGSVVRFTR